MEPTPCAPAALAAQKAPGEIVGRLPLLGVGVGLDVGVCVALGEGEGVALGEALGLEVGALVEDSEGLGEGLGEGDPVGSGGEEREALLGSLIIWLLAQLPNIDFRDEYSA